MHSLALTGGFPDNMDMPHRKITQTAMNQFGRFAGCARGEVLGFNQCDRQPLKGGFTKDARACDAATDEDQVKLILFQVAYLVRSILN